MIFHDRQRTTLARPDEPCKALIKRCSVRTKEYDLIVLGTGDVGQIVALAAANEKWKVAIVEKKAIGGITVAINQPIVRIEKKKDELLVIVQADGAEKEYHKAKCGRQPDSWL